MKYIHLKNPSKKYSFREVVRYGQPPEGGLFMPEFIPALPEELLSAQRLSLQEIALEAARSFAGNDLSEHELSTIISRSLNILLPVFPITGDEFILELFHGPTLAFKDFGIRFLARLLEHFQRQENRELTILTATSGDTGGAAAHAFAGIQGIRVIILYPAGRVSPFQEQQIAAAGKNIIAVRINGNFDDCQHLVKSAFADAELNRALHLSSANSINFGRLLPQVFYYLYAASYLPDKRPPVFSVPSGNFGNLAAGLIAHKMGMKARFIAATNINSAVPEFLASGRYAPLPVRPTLSNAMDVGSPNNFDRILYLFDQDRSLLAETVKGFSVSDAETVETIRRVWQDHHYLLDPHSAVGYAALEKFRRISGPEQPGVVLSTAHPAKFGEVLKDAIGIETALPSHHADLLKKEKSVIPMETDLPVFKEFLRSVSSGAASLHGAAALYG